MVTATDFISTFRPVAQEAGSIFFGSYPTVGLAAARKKAIDASRLVDDGKDPVAERKRTDGLDFGVVADRYLAERVDPVFKNAAHRRQWRRSLTDLAAPIRNTPVSDITVDDILAVLKPVWSTRWPTAKKLRIHLQKTLDFARALGLRSGPNPASWSGNLDAILPPRPSPEQHWPAMPWQDIPQFVAKLREREALAARLCEFAILTGCRSDEARAATFAEINRDESVWIIPPARTKTGGKTGKPTRIPLTQRALEILDEVAPLGDGFPDSLCFPSPRGKKLSDQAVAKLLARMGVQNGTACLHGFRTSLSTWGHDTTGHAWEVVEKALAHAVGNSVSRAYDRGDALEKRRSLMEDWAAFCSSQSREKVEIK
jgi:integrase